MRGIGYMTVAAINAFCLLFVLGMALVFDIDGESINDNIPSNFPTCGNYVVNPM